MKKKRKYLSPREIVFRRLGRCLLASARLQDIGEARARGEEFDYTQKGPNLLRFEQKLVEGGYTVKIYPGYGTEDDIVSSRRVRIEGPDR